MYTKKTKGKKNSSSHSVINVIPAHSPQSSVVVKHVWVCPDAATVEVPYSERLEIPCPGQGHVGLAILKASAERDLHTVKGHALEK